MPSPLVQAAFRVASAFQAVERPSASPITARDVARRELEPLRGVDSLRGDLERVDFILGRFDRDHPPLREARIALLGLEGRLWGEIARSDAAETERFRPLIEGKGPIDVEGIEGAHRWVRWPFIDGLQRVLGDRPLGGRAHHVVRSPLELFPPLSETLGRDVYLKREDRQPVTSFKNRGATNILLHERLTGRRRQPCAASHGNHAQGLALAASNLGFPPVRLFLPVNASPLKIEQCREMGAEVSLIWETFEEAEDEARKWVAERPDERLLVPAYENPLVAMGQGTIGVEIDIEMARLGIEHYIVLVPAGGGGMLAGIATYLAPQIPVFGVESETHPFVSLSFRGGEIVQPASFYHVDTDADGIALQRVGRAGFPNILKYVRDVVAIPEELIRGGIAYLYDHGYTPEGASATPVAALLYGALSAQLSTLPRDWPIVCIYSGRNIHPERLDEIVAAHGGGRWRGLDPAARTQSIEGALEGRGFIDQGKVRPFANARDGMEFVRAVAESLPPSWDLIDAFERLDFGPWEEIKESINATLRSLGMYRERWKGIKKTALLHPYENRATIMIGSVEALEAGRAGLAFFRKRFSILQRLLVEIEVTDQFLQRDDWLARVLVPFSSAGDVPWLKTHLGEAHERLRWAIAKLAERMEIQPSDFEVMTEADFTALIDRHTARPPAP